MTTLHNKQIIDINEDMNEIMATILYKQLLIPWRKGMLVGVTGIDGSGKGYVTQKIVDQLQNLGFKAVAINADGWLNLPEVRFNPNCPGEHFYEHCIRFDEMFEQLVLPLKENRSHSVTVDFAEETATEFRKRCYCFEEVDIVILEGIFLLKEAYRHFFDLSFWVECSFETALTRALKRGQEGLSESETIRAYETIYFPAQRIHFIKDDPRSAADRIILNEK